MSDSKTLPDKRSRSTRPLVLMRPVPGRSVLHELWAGTKLITVAVFAALLAFFPGWASITLVAVYILVAASLAGVTRGALPSVPRVLWILLGAGAVVAAAAGGTPGFALGPIQLGLGGLGNYVQIMLLAVVALGVCALVSWTTHTSEIAPAVSKLGRPFRRLGLPVDDWAATLALALRAFPMLSQEFRVLAAARRLRPDSLAHTRRERLRRWSGDLVDLLAAAMTAALRRADEMGDAITARGGAGQISALQSGPTAKDIVALAMAATVCALSVGLPMVL